MRVTTLLLLAAFLGSGCLADRVVTLAPDPSRVSPAPGAPATPVTVLPFADRRGAIAEGGLDAIGGLYGLRGWPAALRVSEPYPVTLQHALVAALAARGIPATAVTGPPPGGTHVLSATVVDFYGYANWGAGAILSAHVRLAGPEGEYLADKTVTREVKQFGLDTITPRLEDVMDRLITAWADAVVSDARLMAPLLAGR